ncbi:hypothetical protein ANO11243_050640 [Dothideomycetidae sp. 11243]|nr:hypothetical protein ANO11243_050640 [fungal sp. No.11243]
MQRMAERPGWLKDYRDRWLWEKARLKSRFTAFYQFMAVKYFMVRTEHPATVQAMGFLERLQYRLFSWYNFEMWSVTKIADRLYRDMYLALASGDIDSINNKLKKDISQSLKSRVLSRGKNTEAVWTLDKYHHRPRLVAYSVALIDPNKPKWAQSYMQQAVVELDTDQSLTRRKRTLEKQAETAGQNTARRVREYFVIQKSVIDGVGEDWKIWGMTRPTTIQDVRRDLNKQMGLSDDIY